MPTPDPHSARRIELILQQVDSLPTLPAVAMKLLQATSAEDSNAQQVIDLVKGDPSLTGKILSLCRSAATGMRSATITIDRAVVMLGFDAIRNAVLSIKVFETFTDDKGTKGPSDQGTEENDEDNTGLPSFERADFWKHCLSVAIASELIAQRHHEHHDLIPTEAFVCGLLHDIGKLALEHVLPRSYQRVIELTESAQSDIAVVERKLLGIDHHTAGKRLAEKWGLSHAIADCIWLHGSSYRSLPQQLPHRRLIGLIGLSDLLVRRQHIGYSGNHVMPDVLAERAEELQLDPKRIEHAVVEIHEQLEKRAAALGLGKSPSRKLFLESIMQANNVLGRLNTQLEYQRRNSRLQGRTIAAITAFHRSAGTGRDVADLLTNVASSAAAVLGEGHYAIIYQPTGQSDWQINQYNADGRVIHTQLAEPPPHCTQLSSLNRAEELPVGWMGVLPWLTDYLAGFDDLRSVHLLPLPCAWGTAAVLVHDRDELPEPGHLEALAATWGAAIGAATQHEGARRLGEQLAEANRVLTETQDAMMRNQSLARLGEMAAGAAHEMNNPLAVISGRAQLLSMKLQKGTKEQTDAALVFEQAQKLSDLITALHLFAESPRPKFEPVAIDDVLTRAVHLVRQRVPDAPALSFKPTAKMPPLRTDASHLAQVLAELLLNAYEAQPEKSVQVVTQVDPLDDRLIIRVIDDGVGMDAHTLEHAFDPFFSAKIAGRQPGLGLARAQRLIEGLDGTLELTSAPHQGTTATIRLTMRCEEQVGSGKAEVGSEEVIS